MHEGDCSETVGLVTMTDNIDSIVSVKNQVVVGVPLSTSYSVTGPVVVYVVIGNRPLNTVVS